MTTGATLATAGHVDHGKTALVRALTGVDTDRLPEEQQRGISITCGFAPLTLGAATVAVIDVPGHERFIRQMVGGVGGVDAVLLVVAADEGVMPQTREHLAVCRFLQIPRLVVALTRCDLVDADWRALAAADVTDTLADTPWAQAPIVPCSALTGEGLPSLRVALATALGHAMPRPRSASEAPFALPVDRVFTVQGFGTVVTGTCLAGTLAVGAAVALARPGGAVGRSRVRGLERHGARVDRGGAGERLALNLPELGRLDTSPGAIAFDADHVRLARHLEAGLTLDAAARRELKAGDEVLAQVGFATALARLTPLSGRALTPGEAGFVNLRFEAPTPWFPGVPVILRGFERLPGAGLTLAGGQVLRGLDRPTPAPHRPVVTGLLAAMTRADGAAAIMALAQLAGSDGVTEAALRQSLPPRIGGVAAELRVAVAAGRLEAEADRLWARGARPIAPDALAAASARAAVTRADVGQRDTRDLAELCALLLAHGLTPPWRDELSAALAARTEGPPRNVEPLVARGLREGRLVRVSPELIYATGSLAELQRRVLDHLRRGPGTDGPPRGLSVPDLKELAGATRRWAVPLLGWLDRERITVRDGDLRRLHPRHLAETKP